MDWGIIKTVSRRPQVWLVIPMIVIGFFGLVKMVSVEAPRSFDELLSEYPFVTVADSIDSKVVEIYCPPQTRCGGGVNTPAILDDGKKYMISVERELSTGINVADVIASGSRVFKRSGSDTISISGKDEQTNFHRFLLRKRN